MGEPGYRIVVVGTTGSGKTTLARLISGRLGLPHIEMDELHWAKNWTARNDGEVLESLLPAIGQTQWVLDGNYSRFRQPVWERATHIIWLDLPFWQNFFQLLGRTLRRIFTKEVLWSGNKESLRLQLSGDSIMVWFLKTYGKRRRVYGGYLLRPPYAHLCITRVQSHEGAERYMERLMRNA